jgi:hypothetical protein
MESESDVMAFEAIDGGEWRDEQGNPIMPTGIRYTAIDDFLVGRALYLTDDGSGETIVLRLIVTTDEGERKAGHFSLSNEAAVGLFAALGMSLMDCGVGVPDMKTAHELARDILQMEEMEREWDGD